MARQYRVISADSHLEIAADRWSHRLPPQYRDRAPRRIRLPNGGDAHVIEGRPMLIEPVRCLEQKMWPVGGSFDTNAGAGSPERRLKEQDIDGIDAEILYPGSLGPGFWRGIRNDQVYKSVIRAYNEWLAEEYCSVDPDRLIGMGLIPETSFRDAIDEMENCARMGLKGVLLNAWPSGKPLPTPSDDEFWAEAIRIRMPITVHIELHHSPGGSPAGPRWQYAKDPGPEIYAGGADPIRRLYQAFGTRGAKTAIHLIYAGVFDRFTDLQVYFAENQIAWIPMWLEHADIIYQRNSRVMEEFFGLKPLSRLPSEYVREHCLWGFLQSPVGVELRHHIGVDRIMWSTDFPHTETEWPKSIEDLKRSFAGVPEDEKYQIVAGNCIRFFHLQ